MYAATDCVSSSSSFPAFVVGPGLTLVPQIVHRLTPHSARLVHLLSAAPLLRIRNLVLHRPQPPEVRTSGISWSREISTIGPGLQTRIRRLVRMASDEG
jgi:hypothetical protein